MMLFPEVSKINVHISTVYRITEQKLCWTFNNCSLCDRLNNRKKPVCTHMKSVVEHTPRIRIRQQSAQDICRISSLLKTFEVVKFEFKLRHICDVFIWWFWLLIFLCINIVMTSEPGVLYLYTSLTVLNISHSSQFTHMSYCTYFCHHVIMFNN